MCPLLSICLFADNLRPGGLKVRSQIISRIKNNNEHSRTRERMDCLKPAEVDPLSAKDRSSRTKAQSHTKHTWDQEGHWDQVRAETVLAKIEGQSERITHQHCVPQFRPYTLLSIRIRIIVVNIVVMPITLHLLPVPK
jgi:hypothetical protein